MIPCCGGAAVDPRAHEPGVPIHIRQQPRALRALLESDGRGAYPKERTRDGFERHTKRRIASRDKGGVEPDVEGSAAESVRVLTRRRVHNLIRFATEPSERAVGWRRRVGVFDSPRSVKGGDVGGGGCARGVARLERECELLDASARRGRHTQRGVAVRRERSEEVRFERSGRGRVGGGDGRAGGGRSGAGGTGQQLRRDRARPAQVVRESGTEAAEEEEERHFCADADANS